MKKKVKVVSRTESSEVQLTAKEKKTLKRYAKDAGLSVSAYIRATLGFCE